MTPGRDEVEGNGLIWRNKTTLTQCVQGGRKFFRKERESKQERQSGSFNFSCRNMNSSKLLSSNNVMVTIMLWHRLRKKTELERNIPRKSRACIPRKI